MDANASAIWLICALKQEKHPEGCFSCLAVGQGLIRAALPPRLSPYGRRRFAPASTSLTRYVEPLRGPHLLPQPENKKSTPKDAFLVWRWARDSNPGNLSVQRFSRPPLSTTQPAHLNCLRSVAPRKTAIIPRSESDTRHRIKFKQILFPHCSLLRRAGRFAPAVCHEEYTAVQVAARQRPVSVRSESPVTLLVWAALADR